MIPKKQLKKLLRYTGVKRSLTLFARVDKDYWRDNPERVEEEIKRIFARKYRNFNRLK